MKTVTKNVQKKKMANNHGTKNTIIYTVDSRLPRWQGICKEGTLDIIDVEYAFSFPSGSKERKILLE